MRAPARTPAALLRGLNDLVRLVLFRDGQPDPGEDLVLRDLVKGYELRDGVLEAIPARNDATRKGCLNS